MNSFSVAPYIISVHQRLNFPLLTAAMEAQLINYLKFAKVPVGYLINFRDSKVEWRRFIVSGE